MPFPNRYRRAGPGFLTPRKSLSLAALALVAFTACSESSERPTAPQIPSGPTLDVLFPSNGTGNCLGEDYAAAGGGGGITETKGCTANDIRVAAAQVLEYSVDGGQTFIPFTGQQVSCDPGANIQLKLRAFLKETASSTRADIGVWVANDGGSGRLKIPPPPGSPPSFGQCNQYNLAPAPALNAIVDGVTNVDGDACGDMFPSAVQNDSAKLELGTITAKCQGSTPNSPLLHVGSCLSWTVPGPNHACPTSTPGPDGFRFGTLPSSSSKCNCEGFDVPILVGGNIELKKVWVGTPGQTTLNIGTSAGGTQVASQQTGAAGAAPLTTGEKTVNPGTYFVSETGGLTDYSSSLACTDNGANVTPGANGSVSVQSNHTVVCTFTNTLNTGSIELKKVWSGTPSQTTLNIGTTAGGSDVKSQQTGAAGAAPLTTGAQTVTVGTYFVSETGGLAGYAQSLACTDNGTGITPGANNSVSVTSGHTVVCTFTNSRDQGSIELRKSWSGTPGQTTLNIGTTAGGSDVKSQQTGAAGAAPLTTGAQAVNTGTYFVSETGGLTDYTSSLACTDNGASITPGANNSVSVTTGHAVVCTFTNTRNQGTIELKKVWSGAAPGQTTLRIGTAANGTQVSSVLTGAAGAAPLTTGTQNVNTGTYFVSETGGLTEFTSSLACTDNGQSVTPGANGSVSVTTGHAVICTFTNTRIPPQLSITKTPDSGLAGYNVAPGGTATFTIVVANAAGGGSAFDVQLIDTLPAGVNIPQTDPVQKGWRQVPPGEQSCTIALFPLVGTQERRLLTCNIGTLAPNTSFTVVVEAVVPDDFLFVTPTPSGTTIEIDTPSANVVNNGSTDWVDAGLNCAASVKCQLDATGTTDNSFGQGTKEDSPVPTIVSGSIPNNKSDLLRFYVNNARAATGPGGPVHDFIYLAWRRVQAPNGTTNMDFELNQAVAQPGVGNGVTPLRTANDILIKYDLSNGGTNPTIGFHRWLTGGGSAQALCEASNSFPCWSKVTPVSTGALASINTSQISDPIPPPTGGGNVDALTFGEAGIDLQAAGIFTPGSCLSFGSAYLKSRSSDAFNAEVKDFVAPVSISVSDCTPKNLDNRAWVRSSNYAPTAAQLPPSGGALNAWFSDTGQIHVSDASGAFFKSPTNLQLAQSLMGDQAVVTRERSRIAGAGQDVGTPWPPKVAAEPGAAGGARFRGATVIHRPRLVA